MQLVKRLLLAASIALSANAEVSDAQKAIDAEGIKRHIEVLASDEFEGRAPGTRGEELTVAYLTEQFKKLALQPGNPDGSWTQAVPMLGVTSSSQARLTLKGSREEIVFPQDYVGWSQRRERTTRIDESELVFVGYGVEAPEYNWNDFKDVDLKGKTLLMLVNDPPVPGAFKDDAMTYYGRWTYKYEIAAAKGAAAAFVIHETGPAGYPWFVVVSSNGRENFMLNDSKAQTLQFQAWMSLERARQTLAACGHDFDALKKKALSRDFRPIPLGAKLNLSVTNNFREVQSRNVVAKLPGAHPDRKNEYLIYTAHWDHIGRDPKLEGDHIFNGAMDNASGVACMLEIAEAFSKLKPAPDRTVLFLAVTAEEKGLLGAEYYASHPLYPLRQTLANFNMDGASLFGRRSDVGIVGYGFSTLEDLVVEAAKSQNRTVRPELSADKGYYFRSDHFEFAKVGVPALYLDKIDGSYPGRPSDFGKQKRDEFLANYYHKPADEVRADWDYTGAVDDARILFQVGEKVARDAKWPQWRPGTEFKPRRDEMLRE